MILFLDFDGVCNGHLWRRENQSKVFTDLDPAAVAYVNTIVDQTDCQIVISSTWRVKSPIAELRAVLERAGFHWPQRVIGVTPQVRLRGMSDYQRPHRGREISEWLAANPTDTYAVLDDEDYDLGEHAGRVVCTDDYYGLTAPDAERVVEILRGGK